MSTIQELILQNLNIISSGVGGIRTLVQTRKQYAFYTFSLDLVFEWMLDQGHRHTP